MSSGADYVYQAYFEEDGLAGYSDFLEKVDSPSKLGDFSYEVIDTKLARRATAGNAVQLVHYAELISKVQQKDVEKVHLVHGDGKRNTLLRKDYSDYYYEILRGFRQFLDSDEKTEPFPVSYCSFCRYKNECRQVWDEKESLSQISYMSQGAEVKLKNINVSTITQLLEAQWHEGLALSKGKFKDLQQQARSQKYGEILLRQKASLQKLKDSSEEAIFITFFRHIQPVNGSFTFYMGLLTTQGRYEALNISDSQSEMESFERVTNFIIRYLDRYPGTQVYTYSQADISLIHDLSNKYNICHDDVDDLIYKQKLVALQPAIRQSLTLPVTRYSLQDLVLLFDEEKVHNTVFEKSPQLLYDLYDSARVESAVEAINERGKLELDAMEALLKWATGLINCEFPVKVVSKSGECTL